MLKLFSAALILSACGLDVRPHQGAHPKEQGELTKQGKDSNSISTIGSSGPGSGPEPEAEKLWQQIQDEKQHLAKITQINELLCKRMESIQSTCFSSYPISSDAVRELLSCSGEITKQRLKNKVRVKVTTQGNRQDSVFKLRATVKEGERAKVFESDPFNAGESDLVFSSIVAERTLAPSFAEVDSFQIVPTKLSSDVRHLTVSLGIVAGEQTQTLVNDSIENPRIGVGHHLVSKEIYNAMKSAVCRMSLSEYNQMVAEVGEQTQTAKEPQLPKNLEVDKLKTELSQLIPEVEGANNRNFKLKNELLGGDGLGCHLQQQIQSMSVHVIGGGARQLLGKHGKRMPSTGNPSLLSFSMDGVGFTVDLSQENIFGQTYVVPEENYRGMLLNSLTRLEVRKTGVGIDSVAVACNEGGGFFNNLQKFFDSDTCYNNYEEWVINIETFGLTVNGIPLLKANNLAAKLDNKQMMWRLPYPLSSTPEWAEMLRRSDCEKHE